MGPQACPPLCPHAPPPPGSPAPALLQTHSLRKCGGGRGGVKHTYFPGAAFLQPVNQFSVKYGLRGYTRWREAALALIRQVSPTEFCRLDMLKGMANPQKGDTVHGVSPAYLTSKHFS